MTSSKFKFFFDIETELEKLKGYSNQVNMWVKTKPPKGKKVSINIRGKFDYQTPCNHDSKCILCLEIGHIDF
jgi:hypothetical protein